MQRIALKPNDNVEFNGLITLELFDNCNCNELKKLYNIPYLTENKQKKIAIFTFVFNENDRYQNYLKELAPFGYNKILKKNGSFKAIILAVTGNRKIKSVLKYICKELKSSDYHLNRTATINQLNIIEQGLDDEDKKLLPILSNPITKYKFSHATINPGRNQTKIIENKNGNQLLLKYNPAQRKSSEFEVFNARYHHLLLGHQHTAKKAHNITDENNNRLGGAYELINFTSFADILSNNPDQLTIDALAAGGIGRIVMAAFLNIEGDLHLGNLGFNQETKKIISIDRDRTWFLFTAKYASSNLSSEEICAKFAITPTNINNLPRLAENNGRNAIPWIDKWLSPSQLDQLAKHPKFIYDMWYIQLKFAVIPNDTDSNLINSSFKPSKITEQTSNYIRDRKQQEKKFLRNRGFRTFIVQHPELISEILCEFTENNQRFAKDKYTYLRANLDQVRKNMFDNLLYKIIPQENHQEFYNRITAHTILSEIKTTNLASLIYQPRTNAYCHAAKLKNICEHIDIAQVSNDYADSSKNSEEEITRQIISNKFQELIDEIKNFNSNPTAHTVEFCAHLKANSNNPSLIISACNDWNAKHPNSPRKFLVGNLYRLAKAELCNRTSQHNDISNLNPAYDGAITNLLQFICHTYTPFQTAVPIVENQLIYREGELAYQYANNEVKISYQINNKNYTASINLESSKFQYLKQLLQLEHPTPDQACCICYELAQLSGRVQHDPLINDIYHKYINKTGFIDTKTKQTYMYTSFMKLCDMQEYAVKYRMVSLANIFSPVSHYLHSLLRNCNFLPTAAKNNIDFFNATVSSLNTEKTVANQKSCLKSAIARAKA